MNPDTTLVVVFIVAFVIAVFVAAAETALLRMTPARAAALAESHGKRAQRLVTLTDNLPRVLNTILLTALLAQVTAATVVGVLAERWFGSLGVTIASVALTIVLFIYGEAIPKTTAVRHSDRVALALARPVSALEAMLRPIVSVLVWVADAQAPGQGIATSPTVTERELRILAGHAADEGTIDAADQLLIERAFRFGDRRCDDIMVPRTDIVAVADTTRIGEAIDVALEAGHRRLPVFTDDLDNISGMVRLRDMVAIPPERHHLPVETVAMEPLIAPETMRIVALLREMQRSGKHLAVVVDEYGGTAGIATVEDVAEELLGSISEGPAGDALVKTDTGGWSASGLLPVEDLAEVLGEDLPEGDWNTVGGLVLSQLGRLPRVGDEVDIGSHRYRVQSVRGRRIQRLEVTRIPEVQ